MRILAVVGMCEDTLQRERAEGVCWLSASMSMAAPQIFSRRVIYMIGRKTWIESSSHADSACRS